MSLQQHRIVAHFSFGSDAYTFLSLDKEQPSELQS